MGCRSFRTLDIMKKTFIYSVSLLALFSTVIFAQDERPHNYMPPSGYVPDAQTAIRIAEAVWEPIYGKEKIASERPFRATLKNGVWIVEGSLPSGMTGGVAIAEISKKDAKVLRVSHGK